MQVTRWPPLSPLIAFALLLTLVTACSAQPATGRAIETFGTQKAIVRETAIQVIVLHEKKQLDDARFAQFETVYRQWAAAERELADAVAAWIVVKTPANEAAIASRETKVREVTRRFVTIVNTLVPGLIDSVRKKLGTPNALKPREIILVFSTSGG